MMSYHVIKPEAIETILADKAVKDAISNIIIEAIRKVYPEQNIVIQQNNPTSINIPDAVKSAIENMGRKKMGLNDLNQFGTAAAKVADAFQNMAKQGYDFNQIRHLEINPDDIIDPKIIDDFLATNIGITPEGFSLGGFITGGSCTLPKYIDHIDPFNLLNKGLAGVRLRHPHAAATNNPTSETEKTMQTKPAEMINVVGGYETLASVLALALEQAQNGKGNQRHQVGNTPFSQQPICELARLYGTGYNFGQAAKKAHETQQLDTLKAKQAELLGAINYLAAAYIVLSEGQ